jgi:cell division protein FtsA
MARRERYLVGLDVGTSKIAAIVGEVMDDGNLDIIGIGLADSKGIRRGVVNNVDSAADAIKRAIDEAELTAGIEIDSVYLALSGAHVKAFNSRGVVAVAGRNREITREDVKRAIDAARAVALPGGREIFHVLPQDFVVDDQDGIAVPVGMTGGRLEVNVHVVTGSSSSMQNMIACVNRAGVEVVDTVLEQLAASESVLTADEKDLGVALVDVGGGTTDFAVFERGSLWHTGVIAVGGDHFTNDIAVGLRMPIPDAEKLKRRAGCALTTLVPEDETMEVASIAGRRARMMPRRVLSEILREIAEFGYRAHGRRRVARGHGRDRRADLRPPGAARGARGRRRAGRSREQSGVCHLRRPVRLHAPPPAARAGAGRRGRAGADYG